MEISYHQMKIDLDEQTQEGRDLYAAWQLISMFGMPPIPEATLPDEAKNELKRVRDSYETPHPYNVSYEAAANLCLNYDSIPAHLIAFMAFKNMPAAYRSEAIREMQRAIELGHSRPFDVYTMGLLQSKEGDQASALENIAKAMSLAPQNPFYYKGVAAVLVKMNEPDQALSILYSYRDGAYYAAEQVIDDSGLPINTRTMIDYAIKDIEEKKAKGYVYRPRKKQQ